MFFSTLQTAAAQADTGRRLFLLTIGVSNLKNDPGHGLRYAAKDARELASTLIGQRRRLFDEVIRLTLTEEQATKVNIERALVRLKTLEIGPEDYVVVAVAGHGCINRGNYYFVPFDFDPGRGAQTCISWTTFRNALAKLPGMRLLILDTCKAGGAAGSGTTAATLGYVQGGAPGTGLITFAACLSVEDARDGLNDLPWLENGVFTRSLIEALQGHADTNSDGVVTLGEVSAYVSNRVQVLTNGKQNPSLECPSSIPLSLPLARLGTCFSPAAGSPGFGR
jgi:uncharacterized caspase-like protein